VLAHAAVLLLLVSLERHASHRIPAPELQFVSIWPQPHSQMQPVPTEKTATPMTRAGQPQLRPLTPATPNSAQQEEPTDPAERSAQSPIDWNAAATDAAARFARNTGGQQTFSAAPQAMRKPCKPRQFDAETQGMMAERLPEPPDPDPVGPDPKANCIVVGGYPKCVQKIRIRRRPSLFSMDRLENRVADKTPAPSVSSPEVCD
jgi:hypothetical protein